MKSNTLLNTLEKVEDSENLIMIVNSFNSIENGKLVKEERHHKVQLPEFVARKYDYVDIKRLSKMELGKLIINFVNIVKKNFFDSDLTNFYNNINEVEVINKSKYLDYLKREKPIGTLALYSCLFNEIKISYNKYAIYHELFHLLATFIKEDAIYSGFMQYKDEKEYETTMGKSIDEGYTQLLTQRYFGNIKHVPKDKNYTYQVYIVSKLENIVGKNKMQSLYANGNLYGLISELQKYTSHDQIINFIDNMDFVFNVQYDSLKTTEDIMCYKCEKIAEFLITCYSKKMIYTNDLDNAKKSIKKYGQNIVDNLSYYSPKRFIKSSIAKRESVINNLNSLTNYIVDNITNLYDESNVDTIKSITLNIETAISNIEFFITNQFPNINLSNFHKNISRISINPDLYEKKQNSLDYSQVYSALLSMIGTDDNKEIKNKKLNIPEYGYGFNNFYSKTLTKRYFSKTDQNIPYIINELEELVGKQKLESLYLNKNISGLVESLSEYADLDNISRFIMNMDYLNDILQPKSYVTYSKYNIDDALEYINKFLLNCYYKRYKKNEVLVKSKKEILEYNKELLKNRHYSNFSLEQTIIYTNPNLIRLDENQQHKVK